MSHYVEKLKITRSDGIWTARLGDSLQGSGAGCGYTILEAIADLEDRLRGKENQKNLNPHSPWG